MVPWVTNSAITGATGLYYAAAALSERGWLVTPTLGNAPRTDLLVQHPDQHRAVAIQVKTKTGKDFQLGGVDPSPVGADEWCLLIALREVGERPTIYVVPRNHASAVAHLAYEATRLSRIREGHTVPPHDRRFAGEQEFLGYKEAWHLLDGEADAVPTSLLPDWIWDWLKDPEVDLPETHPGLAHGAEA